MKKRNALIIISVVWVIVAVLVIGLFYFQGKLFAAPEKLVDVSNLNIDHATDWSNCNLNFTVTNLYNYPITVIGSTVNGVNYGYSNNTVPPGQTQDESIILPHLIVTKAANYSATLAFTFGNGQYQVYSQTVLPPKYIGSFYITDESLTFTWANSSVYSATIQNTGTLPIVAANYSINSVTSQDSGSVIVSTNTVIYQSSLPIYRTLFHSDTAVLNGQPIFSSSLQLGSNYIVFFQVTYFDQSTNSVKSSVPMIAEAPTPTPQPTPTPKATPSPHPTPTPVPTPTPFHP